jgi:hypothetical protein
MKNLIYSIIFSALLLSCSDNKPKKVTTDIVNNPASAINPTDSSTLTEGAAISFEKIKYDFGTITQGEQAEYSFKFINIGKQDLLITNANASCGCTVPQYSKEPIKPGEQGMIKVKFNSDYRLDAFEKTVTVTANTIPLETILTIKGFINPKPGTQTQNSPIH